MSTPSPSPPEPKPKRPFLHGEQVRILRNISLGERDSEDGRPVYVALKDWVGVVVTGSAMTASLPKREGFVYLIGVKARDETLASTSIIAVPEDAILHEDEAQKRDLFNEAAMLVHEGKLDGSVLVRAGALGWQPEEQHEHVHETVGHFALHLAKGMLELNTAVSLLARAAEKLDHPDKAVEGRALLQQWLDERAENMHHYVDLVTEAVKVELGVE